MNRRVRNVGLALLAVGMGGGVCAIYMTMDVALRDLFEIQFCLSGVDMGGHIRASFWGHVTAMVAIGGGATFVAVVLSGLCCRKSACSVVGAMVSTSCAILAFLVLTTSLALREVCWKHGADIAVSRPSSQSAVFNFDKRHSDPMTNHADNSTNE